ncbi:DUF5994 family protein [Streptomyces chrestomyceticus]|uniref:DUF5994 family protein n=1 Tax=Streptomyces chrestomyceticus TaxID=68185 RepID=UPI0033F6DDBE
MTITSAPPAAPHHILPTRLALLPQGTGLHRIDGAWWPRTRHLADELPPLLDALAPRWGRITRVTVDNTMWRTGPHRLVLGRRVIHISRSIGMGHHHSVCLLTLGTGRCDLLVIAPDTPPDQAEHTLTAASRVDGGTGAQPRPAGYGPHPLPT